MKLDDDLKDNIRSYVSGIINDYTEKDIDFEKFLLFLFGLYEQSSSLDEFSDTCLKELVDFCGDNTENFVNDIMTHISMNVESPNEVDRKNSRAAHNNNSEGSNSPRSDHNLEDLEDDMIPDDDDEEADRNYRRAKNKSDENKEEQTREESTNTHKHQKQPNEHKKENSSKHQKNNQHKNKGLPPGPPPHIPMQMQGMMGMVHQPHMGQIAPPPMNMKGQVPMMPPGTWSPYQYMYPPAMGYMPTMPTMPTMPASYPPVYPYEMPYPPPQIVQEVKSSDYDPLHPEMKMGGKPDVKPPSSKSHDKPYGKRPLNIKHDEEEPSINKVHVVDKEGKKGPRPQQDQHQQQHPQKRIVPQQEGGNPQTTIYIKNIPDYYNNLEALNKQLKRFGPIVNIKVDLKAKMATVEFARPKHAKLALSNKQPLFGNKEILVVGDPSATSEDAAKEAKPDARLVEKLKFLIEIKKHVSGEAQKVVVQKINDIKQAQKVLEIPEQLKKLLEYPTFDTNVDFTQIIENIPDTYLTEKNKLSGKLEAFGKFENFKLNPKTKTLDLKFYNLESAKKAQEKLSGELQIRFVNEKVSEVIDKINEFENTFLKSEPAAKKTGDVNGGSGANEEVLVT